MNKLADQKNNASCAICGNGYYKCLSCQEQARLSPWKLYTDTSEHYKVFQIIHGHTIGVYTKEEARKKLETVDLSDLGSFVPHIRSAVEAILMEDSSVQEDDMETDTDSDNISQYRDKKNSKLKTKNSKNSA